MISNMQYPREMYGKGEVTDGNNWLVLRSDIEKAFNQLAEAKQNILRIRVRCTHIRVKNVN